jgi:hypothetical protein
MSKVKNKNRGRVRDIKHQMLIKDIARKKNLDGCNGKNTK